MLFRSGAERGGLRIKEYNVVEDAVPIKEVVFTSSYLTFELDKMPFLDGDGVGYEVNPRQTWAVAERTDIDVGRRISEQKDRIKNGHRLAVAAVNRLLQAVHEAKRGELVLNPYFSGTRFGNIWRLTIGDHVGVIGNPDGHCNSGWESEVFVVNGISHTMDDSGWSTSLEVGKVQPTSNISARSWKFDPVAGETINEPATYSFEGLNYDG